jgi:hypothetical protein
MEMQKHKSDDVILLRGCIELQLLNAQNGKPVGERFKQNLVVTSGRKWVLDRLKSSGGSAQMLSHLAVGTTATAPATDQTALINETARKAIATQTLSSSENPPFLRNEVLFATDEANATLKEAGLFNSSSSGTMLNRVTFADIVKATSNTLSVTMTISN